MTLGEKAVYVIAPIVWVTVSFLLWLAHTEPAFVDPLIEWINAPIIAEMEAK